MCGIPTKDSRDRRGMTPNTVLRLEKFLGMSAGFWMDLQLRCDLCHAHEQNQKDLESIRPHTGTTPC